MKYRNNKSIKFFEKTLVSTKLLCFPQPLKQENYLLKHHKGNSQVKKMSHLITNLLIKNNALSFVTSSHTQTYKITITFIQVMIIKFFTLHTRSKTEKPFVLRVRLTKANSRSTLAFSMWISSVNVKIVKHLKQVLALLKLPVKCQRLLLKQINVSQKECYNKTGMLEIKCHYSSCKWTASQRKCPGLLWDDICLTVASFAVSFFKSCISSSHFRWSHRYAKEWEKNNSQMAEYDRKNVFIWCMYDGQCY